MGGNGSVSNLWVTGCITVSSANADIDFADGLETAIEGLWIKNDVCGDVSFRGRPKDEDKFVRDNLTGSNDRVIRSNGNYLWVDRNESETSRTNSVSRRRASSALK